MVPPPLSTTTMVRSSSPDPPVGGWHSVERSHEPAEIVTERQVADQHRGRGPRRCHAGRSGDHAVDARSHPGGHALRAASARARRNVVDIAHRHRVRHVQRVDPPEGLRPSWRATPASSSGSASSTPSIARGGVCISVGPPLRPPGFREQQRAGRVGHSVRSDRQVQRDTEARIGPCAGRIDECERWAVPFDPQPQRLGGGRAADAQHRVRRLGVCPCRAQQQVVMIGHHAHHPVHAEAASRAQPAAATQRPGRTRPQHPPTDPHPTWVPATTTPRSCAAAHSLSTAAAPAALGTAR